jgi:hypothetical protein
MGLRELMKVNVQEQPPEQVSSLEYLQRIYRDPAQPYSVRMKAAIESLPYENPKLSAVGHFDDQSFASRLDKAIARTNNVLLIEGKTIEVEE